MKLFLIIVAGIVVGCFVVLLALVIFVRLWLRRMVNRISGLVEEASKGIAPFVQPLRITLVSDNDVPWSDAAAIEKVVAPLRSAGFEEVGAFRIEEFPDTCLRGFAQPTSSVYAVVYDHPDRGIWFDVVSRYADGNSLTFTTAPETGLDRPAEKIVERFDSSIGPAEMYQQHLARRSRGALVPATIESFERDFEQAYADEMDWRFERGGFSENEIRSSLKLLGSDVDAQDIKRVHVIQQTQVDQWLHTKLRENFRETSGLTDEKWEGLEDRLIFVHDRLSNDEVSGLLINCLDWDDADAAERIADDDASLGSGTPRDMFARMLQALDSDRIPQKIGQLTHPVVTDVYLLPESAGD